jgi:predicted neutral ceramidase superfamily lipid hydrolase
LPQERLRLATQPWIFQHQDEREAHGMSELQKLKQLMGLGFGGSVVAAVEAQKQVIDDLKVALGLPQDASLGELAEKVSVIKAEHEEFMQKRAEWEASSTGFWKKLFGSK